MNYWFVVEKDGPSLWLVAVEDTEDAAKETKARVVAQRPNADFIIFTEVVPLDQAPAKEFKRVNRIGMGGNS
ncbi:MAG TPA: hypothetical protein VKA31_11505 [Mariprofundaceae bacterium]|nr:hypothetical protein [Mariprofundaceae bacterium]